MATAHVEIQPCGWSIAAKWAEVSQKRITKQLGTWSRHTEIKTKATGHAVNIHGNIIAMQGAKAP